MESSAAALRKVIRKGSPEVVTSMLRMRRNQPCKAERRGILAEEAASAKALR